MENVTLSKKQYDELQANLIEIKSYMKKIAFPYERYISNKEFTEVMDVSSRTAQTWRDEGKIGFSQEGRKIYYSLKDIEEFMKNHYNQAFAFHAKLKKFIR